MKKIIITIIAIIMAMTLVSCGKEEPMYTLILEPYDGCAYITICEEGAKYGVEYTVHANTIKHSDKKAWIKLTKREAQEIVNSYF